MVRTYIHATNALADLKTSVEKFVVGRLPRVCEDESGATAIEYGLLVAAIGVAIISIVFLLGSDLSDLYESIDEKLVGKKACAQKGQNCGNN